jgi:hypothetical protein
MSDELKLYKLIIEKDEYGVNYVDEMGWISDTEFCVWVMYMNVADFMKGLTDIFGYGLFDDGGFDANMQSDGMCIDLCKAVGYSIDIESI